ncbi:hypothetical protein B0I35DRAFT_403509 [Stachybotrys elegans]|uniref:Uncharacterized protein n=1 Tax=Stachybotrys elegans TaxID=80388 RepID=A0A8K0WVX6_9HYPO|nr:hypothetical protein B0I35DRAFT_403509 [Stachybotrys elegans]
MKFSAVFAGAFAALAAAAPTTSPATSSAIQERAVFDASQLNNLIFAQQDFQYLLNLNSLDLVLFQNLALNNGFNALAFQGLFNAQAFDINALLQFQQLQTFLTIAQTGVFNGVNLAGLQLGGLGGLNFGLINGIAGVNLQQFINVANIPQIQLIAGGVPPTVIVKKD